MLLGIRTIWSTKQRKQECLDDAHATLASALHVRLQWIEREAYEYRFSSFLYPCRCVRKLVRRRTKGRKASRRLRDPSPSLKFQKVMQRCLLSEHPSSLPIAYAAICFAYLNQHILLPRHSTTHSFQRHGPDASLFKRPSDSAADVTRPRRPDRLRKGELHRPSLRHGVLDS
jgi:hypothetical protein